MNYRLIDGQICSQSHAGDSWMPLSKQKANDLLDRLGKARANDDQANENMAVADGAHASFGSPPGARHELGRYRHH